MTRRRSRVVLSLLITCFSFPSAVKDEFVVSIYFCFFVHFSLQALGTMLEANGMRRPAGHTRGCGATGAFLCTNGRVMGCRRRLAAGGGLGAVADCVAKHGRGGPHEGLYAPQQQLQPQRALAGYAGADAARPRATAVVRGHVVPPPTGCPACAGGAARTTRTGTGGRATAVPGGCPLR